VGFRIRREKNRRTVLENKTFAAAIQSRWYATLSTTNSDLLRAGERMAMLLITQPPHHVVTFLQMVSCAPFCCISWSCLHLSSTSLTLLVCYIDRSTCARCFGLIELEDIFREVSVLEEDDAVENPPFQPLSMTPPFPASSPSPHHQRSNHHYCCYE